MSIKQLAHNLSTYGRGGDSVLVHMQPHEVAGLQALAKANGTSLTVNPETGLPEAFSLGGFFSSMLPTIAGFVAPGLFPASPMMAGILAGAATGALTNKKNPLMGAAMGGLGGWGGANLAKSALGTTGETFADFAGKAGLDPEIAAVNTPGAQLPMSAPSTGQAAYTPEITNYANTALDYSKTGAMQPYAAPGAEGVSTFYGNTPSYLEEPSNLALTAQTAPSTGAATSRAFENIAADPLKFVEQNKMGVGMPLATAALSGLEPSDIYGNPIKPDGRGKYDPYASLNLSGDTGLRLYAQGGPVSFADGGSSLKMEGDQPDMAPVDTATEITIMPISTAQKIDEARRQQEADLALKGQRLPYMGGAAGLNRELQLGQAAQALPAGGIGSLAPAAQVAQTAPTAMTAQTAAPKYNMLEAANLRKQYASGGTITTGGMQDLYGSSDDTTAGVALSRDGYGLGRLNAMAQGGMPQYAGYADGGDVDYSKQSVNLNEASGLKDTTPVAKYSSGFNPDATLQNSLRFTDRNPNDYFSALSIAMGDRFNQAPDAYYNAMMGRLGQTFPGAKLAKGGSIGYADGGDVVNLNTTSGLANPKTALVNGLDPAYVSWQAQPEFMRSYRPPTAESLSPLRNKVYNIITSNPENKQYDWYAPMVSELGGLIGKNEVDSGLHLAKGGYLDGPGDGMSDSIPATIEGQQPARLADGEFVVPADVVSHLGNGSTKAGSQRLYGMLDKVRKARTGTTKQGKKINPNKFLPA